MLKDKKVYYVMSFGRITNPGEKDKFFARLIDVVLKDCGTKTLSVDSEADFREGYDGPFFMFVQFSSKRIVQDCFKGAYQKIILLREGIRDMNFRIVERNI